MSQLIAWLESCGPNKRTYFEELEDGQPKILPYVEKAPSLDLKPLPSHLKYAYLGERETLPIIVAADLPQEEEEMLLEVLRQRKPAITWSLADIKGISPSFCTHRILMEENNKPVVERQ